MKPKLLTTFLIAAIVLGAVAGNAAVQDSTPAPVTPAEPTQLSKAKLLYKILTSIAVDSDVALQESGINIQKCTYQSLVTKTSTSYKGIGPCLYLSFKESMKTTELSGYIYAWGPTQWGTLKGMRMEWRPAKGGWMETIRAWADLRFESYFVWRKSEKLLSQQALLGELKLYFPKEFPVQKLAMDSHPVKRHDGIIEFEGIFQIASDKNRLQNMSLDFETNINVIDTKRKFNLRGHSRREIGEMP